jgi:hypothetical protein
MESASSACPSGSTPSASLTADSARCIPAGTSRRDCSMFRHTRATTVVSHPPRLLPDIEVTSQTPLM